MTTQLDAIQEPLAAERAVTHAWRLRGSLDVGALRGAATLMMKSEGAPVWTQADLSSARPSYRETRLHERLREERYRSFAGLDALTRVSLYRLSADEHVLLWIAHEMVWGTRRADTFLRALGEVYEALATQALVPTQEPTAPARPLTVAKRRGSREPFSLPAQEVASARSLASRTGRSLGHVCLAAFRVLLARLDPRDWSIDATILDDVVARHAYEGPRRATFRFEPGREDVTHLGALLCSPIRFRDPVLHGEIALTLRERCGGLLASLDYAPEVYAPEEITLAIAEYRQLLASCGDPEREDAADRLETRAGSRVYA